MPCKKEDYGKTIPELGDLAKNAPENAILFEEIQLKNPYERENGNFRFIIINILDSIISWMDIQKNEEIALSFINKNAANEA